MAKFKLIDITGKKFGRILVLSLNKTGKRTKWNCICDCGNPCIKESYSLKNGLTTSCGCYRKELTTKRKTTHGLSKHPLFLVLQKMKDRCNNSKVVSYKNYGGRGITVCESWSNNVESFINWAVLNGYEPGLEIDRIDNNGNYEPSNCRFVTTKINSNNKRNNVKIKYNGKLMGLDELEKISNNISHDRILRRYRDYKWSIEKAISEPVRKNKSSLKSERQFANYQ